MVFTCFVPPVFCIFAQQNKKTKFHMTKRNLYSLFLFLFFLGFHVSMFGQDNAPFSKSDKVYKDPDVIPMYTGGSAEMNRFITNNLQYPAEARENNKQGLVVYTFVVEKDGTLSNFNIIHRADPLLDAEALRILQAMPPWRPARFKGEIVRSETYVPMYFRLNANARSVAGSGARQTQAAIAKVNKEITENEDVYSIVDVMPRFEAGEAALGRFISKQLRYPVDARQGGVEGRILCTFIVAKDGSISNIEVVQGKHPSLDLEAVRVLSIMPRWIPGKNSGENVNVKCMLPIDFVIDEEPIPLPPAP